MAIVLKLPALSKGMIAGQITCWLKSSGDHVRKGEPIVEVETEKATVELESPENGTLLKVLVQSGQETPVGTALCWIGKPGENIDESDADTRATIPQSGVLNRP